MNMIQGMFQRVKKGHSVTDQQAVRTETIEETLLIIH